MNAVSKASLLTIMPAAVYVVDSWLEPLNAAMTKYEINTPLRAAAFLAQVAHETMQLKWIKEIWGPTAAQKGYEGRADLGNTQAGDGSKYRGRGLFQITGRSNYAAYEKASSIPCVQHPEMLELLQYAADSAGWYWVGRGLNALADNGSFKEITKKINGGYMGWTERSAFYLKAKAVLT